MLREAVDLRKITAERYCKLENSTRTFKTKYKADFKYPEKTNKNRSFFSNWVKIRQKSKDNHFFSKISTKLLSQNGSFLIFLTTELKLASGLMKEKYITRSGYISQGTTKVVEKKFQKLVSKNTLLTARKGKFYWIKSKSL